MTFPGSIFNLAAFGTTKAKLMTEVMRRESIVRQSLSNAVFVRTEPQVIWWKLNHENFALIINGNSFGATELMWNGCQLPPIQNGQLTQWLANVTDTKYAGDKSPRKVWSHGD